MVPVEVGTYGGVNEILQDSLVNLLEGSASGSLLLHSGNTGGLSHHSSLSDEDNVSVRELLLELSSKSVNFGIMSSWSR